jgi:hypothetical protein
MTRVFRASFSFVLAGLLLLVGASPAVVICWGPGDHCHLETVVGSSCNEQISVSKSSAPRDGCPKGSKDFKLHADTHRSDNSFNAAAFPPFLTVIAGAKKPFKCSDQPQEISLSPLSRESHNLTTVLRL